RQPTGGGPSPGRPSDGASTRTGRCARAQLAVPRRLQVVGPQALISCSHSIYFMYISDGPLGMAINSLPCFRDLIPIPVYVVALNCYPAYSLNEIEPQVSRMRGCEYGCGIGDHTVKAVRDVSASFVANIDRRSI